MKKIIRAWSPILLPLAVGLALRVYFLLHRGTLWFDELFSIRFSSFPWQEAIHYWILETNPPLYMLFLRAYLSYISPHQATLVRLPSLLFAIGTMVALYQLAKKMFSTRAAFFAAWFFALSGLHIILSAEARMYSLLALLTSVSALVFYLIFWEKKTSGKMWLLLGLIDTLLMYTHLTAAVFLLTQALTLIALQPAKKNLNAWWVTHAGVISLWLVWAIPATINKLHLGFGSAWYFEADLYRNTDILWLIVSAFGSAFATPFIFTGFTIAVLAGIVLIILNLKNQSIEQRKISCFLSLWGGLPLVFSALLGVFIPKYLVVAHLALFILAGELIGRWAVNWKRAMLALAVIFFVLGQAALSAATSAIAQWTDLTSYIEKHETPTSLIISSFNEVVPLQEYYHGRRPIVGVYVEPDNYSFAERLVRHNWYTQYIDERKATVWLHEQISMNRATKIFFVLFGGRGNSQIIYDALQKAGWAIKGEKATRGLFTYYVYEFDAPKNDCPAPIPSK